MAKNRVSGYPMEFWREIGIMQPKQKDLSPEEIKDAYQIIADFPTTFGMIEETYEAFQNVREDPRLNSEQRARMITRYGAHVETMFSAAKRLGEIMNSDLEAGGN